MAEREKLIELKDVQITFGSGRKKFVAVDNVNFDIYKGETFSLVGESGSGKTTIGRAILRINPTSAGEILFKGRRINGRIDKELDKEVIRKCQMIFQDPYASLNPRMTVEEIIAEGAKINGIFHSKEELKENVKKMLELVGLTSEHATRYPHEFSGGQRQRICIARALITKPDLIIADEPISALDVSIQAQVLNLLNDLRHELGLTILFIAHDLSVVKYFSERVAVMNRGRIVEMAPSELLYQNPVHPYTRSLLSAIPIPNPILEKKRVRFSYDPAMHVYDEQNQPQMIEVEPGHLVFLSQKEYQEYLEAKKHEG